MGPVQRKIGGRQHLTDKLIRKQSLSKHTGRQDLRTIDWIQHPKGRGTAAIVPRAKSCKYRRLLPVMWGLGGEGPGLVRYVFTKHKRRGSGYVPTVPETD